MERLTHLNGVKEKLDFFKFLENLGTELPEKMRSWIFQFKYTNMFEVDGIREKLSWVQRVKRDFENGMQLFEPRKNPPQDSKTERDELIAQSEQLFSEITQIATAISQKMSKTIQLIELFWMALDNKTKTVLKDNAVAMREKFDSLPPVLESLLKEFKSSAKHSLGEMRVIYQMALEMKVEAKGHLKQLGDEDPIIDVKLVPEVSESDDVAKEIAERLKEAVAHKILNPLATSETLISPEDKKESQKKIPDTLDASEDMSSSAGKSDVAHKILHTPVVSEEPDDVIKTPDNEKDSEAMNPATEKAELVAQCEQLFPVVAQTLIKHTEIMTEYLKELNEAPLTDEVKKEIKDCKEVLQLIDCVPANLLKALKKMRENDEVEVEKIREMMLQLQNIRRRMEAEVKRFEGMGIDVGEQANGKETTDDAVASEDRDDVTKAPNGKKDLEDALNAPDASKTDVFRKIGKKIVATEQKSDVVIASEDPDNVTKAPNGKKDLEDTLDALDVSKSSITVGVSEDVVKTPDDKKDSKVLYPATEKAELVAQCSQLFPEVARSLLKLTGILTVCHKKLNDAPQTDAVKTVAKDCKDVLASIDGVPRSLLNGLNRIKRDDTVEVEQIREMMVTVQNIRQKTEVELKRFEGLGIYEDVGEETTNSNPEEKSVLIALCEQLFSETGQVASKLLRKMTKRIKQIEDLPQKTDACKEMLETCQMISNYCEPIPEVTMNELMYLQEYSDYVGVEEIRDTMGKVENMKRMLENKLKQCEDDSEDSEDVTKAPDNKKRTTVILNYEKSLLIAECKQLFPEVIQMASTLVSKLSKLIKQSEGLEPKTKVQKNALENCLIVVNRCEPVPESMMNELTHILKNSNEIRLEEIQERLERAQENKLQLEEWLSTLENPKPSDCIDIADVVDTVSLQKDKQELIAEYEQLAKEISQIAMHFSTKLSETAEASTRVSKPEELPKDFREDFEQVAETYKGYSTQFENAIGQCKKLGKGEIVKQILKMQKYKVQLEMEVQTIAEQLWKKDSQNANDAPDVKTMAVTDGVSEVIKTSDDKKDYEAMNPAAGKAELVAHSEKFIPEVVQSVIKFLGFLTKYIERLEDASQTDAVKADLKDCKYVLKPIEGLPAKLLNVLRRIKGDDTFDVEEIRETMVKVHAIRREMETGMKRFEGMDMDVGEQANGKETTDGVSEDVIKTPDDKKDSEDVGKALEDNKDLEIVSEGASKNEEPDVFQTIGKKMFGSIPEANALIDPRSRKARSINPDDYDYVGSMYPDDFTHYLEHRRKFENRDFDFDCSCARLQFLAVFFFVLFSILFVVLWIETFVY